MAYSEKVVDHYNNPRNVGSFTKDTPGVGTGLLELAQHGEARGHVWGAVIEPRKDVTMEIDEAHRAYQDLPY